MKLPAMSITWGMDKDTLGRYVTATLADGTVFDSRTVRQMEGKEREIQSPMLADVLMAVWYATGKQTEDA